MGWFEVNGEVYSKGVKTEVGGVYNVRVRS